MNYPDEPYVRLYTSETAEWTMMSYEARTVMLHLLKGRFDRAGILAVGKHDPARVVASLTRIPEEVAKKGIAELLDNGTFERGPDCIVWPKYIEAQTCSKSEKLRKREYREKLAKDALMSHKSDQMSQGVPDVSHPVPKCPPETVTEAGTDPETEAGTGGLGGKPPKSTRVDRDVLEIYEHWKSVMNAPTAKLDPKRKRLIKAALKLGYTVDELKRAATNVSNSDWHMGRDPTNPNKRNCGMDLIYRDADHIDRYMTMHKAGDGSNGQQALTPEEQAHVAKRVKQLEAMGLERKAQ